MFRVNSLLGFVPSGWQALMNPRVPWTRVRYKGDPSLNPSKGGGRRMTHPFLPDILYARTPDVTTNFDFDRLRAIPAVFGKTQGGTAVAKYPEFSDDVIISEIWEGGQQASTTVEIYRLFREYFTSTLPTDRYIGWQPRDLSPYNYYIELLDVQLGDGQGQVVEELGEKEPFMMRQRLTVTFHLIAEILSPAGVVTSEGD